MTEPTEHKALDLLHAGEQVDNEYIRKVLQYSLVSYSVPEPGTCPVISAATALTAGSPDILKHGFIDVTMHTFYVYIFLTSLSQISRSLESFEMKFL